MIQKVALSEHLSVGVGKSMPLGETVFLSRAKLNLDQHRPKDWKKLDSAMEDLFHADGALRDLILKKGTRVESDGIWVPNPKSYERVGEPSENLNQLTNVGIQFLNQQGYQGTGAGQGSYTATNGLNYIALSNSSSLVPAATDTVLTGEITTGGLARVQGTVSYALVGGPGVGTSTISNLFTASASFNVYVAALFNLSSAGIIMHEIAFTERTLISGDTLQVTYTISLGTN